ncbi:MAG: hypothetical protein ACOYZ6_06705 [Chloroflexota bacterium]
MQNKGLTRWLWLFLLVVLILGCGTPAIPPTPTPLPTLTSTSTPIPPTETPTPTDTPTPTITPVPTQSLDDILEALMPAAQGSEVAEAAAYDLSKPGIHPIVFIAAKDQDDWNESLPVEWKPSNVNQAELVAVVRYINVQTDVRRYRTPGTTGGNVYVRTYRVDTEVLLREARTGNLIATTTFKGEPAPNLPDRLPAGTTALYGIPVPFGTIQLWLKDYVEVKN